MREILFRGKAINNEFVYNKWVYGSFVDCGKNLKAIYHGFEFGDDEKFIVIPETVGQYTGVNDKNGTKIFEGDIIKQGLRPLMCIRQDKAFIRAMEEVIDNTPTADVQEVKHGEWIKTQNYGEFECSVCRGRDTSCSDYYGTHYVTEQEYCPFCGAKMDKE